MTATIFVVKAIIIVLSRPFPVYAGKSENPAHRFGVYRSHDHLPAGQCLHGHSGAEAPANGDTTTGYTSGHPARQTLSQPRGDPGRRERKHGSGGYPASGCHL